MVQDVFIGEVKYTQNVGYVATGLRELLEYMAFVRHSNHDGDYVEAPEDLLDSVSVRGLLFVDKLNRDTASETAIDVVQYPDQLEPLEFN